MRLSLRFLLYLLCLVLQLLPCAAWAQDKVLLRSDTSSVRLWPWVQVMREGTEPISVKSVLSMPEQFSHPQTAYQTLGIARTSDEHQADFYWVRIPLRTQFTAQQPYILHIDFAVLNLIDVYLIQQGEVRQRFLQGNLMPFSERPIPVATHAFNLNLEPNQDYELYLRIGSNGTFVLPITLEKPGYFQRSQQNELLLQGIVNGLCLSLLVFSLGKWLLLRDSLYFKYALVIAGIEMFFLLFSGLGSQYLWDGNAWIEIHMGLIGTMVAATGSLLFSEHLLRPPQDEPHAVLSLLMLVCIVFTAGVCLLYGLNFISTEVGVKIASMYSLIPVLVTIPLAWQRWRKDGEKIGLFFVINLSFYTSTAAVMSMVIHGTLPANFWTIHSLQIGSLVDILVFMLILSMRSELAHKELQIIRQDQQLRDSDTIIDSQTGLMVRTTFMQRLELTLNRSQPRFLTAVYIINPELIDSTNDSDWLSVQHDALVAVGQRLRNQMRGNDMVCRWGENSFSIMAVQLRSPEQAHAIALKLLHLVVEPIQLGTYELYLGTRIGYALAPTDGNSALDLMRMADIAVYTRTHQINQIQRYNASAAA